MREIVLNVILTLAFSFITGSLFVSTIFKMLEILLYKDKNTAPQHENPRREQ